MQIETGIKELDWVLGGGLVPGNVIVLGGLRGVGATTLALQAADGYARFGRRAYYASGEQRSSELQTFAKRLNITNPCINVNGYSEGIDVDEVLEGALSYEAGLLVVDSIETTCVDDVRADFGSNTMKDAVLNMLSSYAAVKNVAVLAINHLVLEEEKPDTVRREKFDLSVRAKHTIAGCVRVENSTIQYGTDMNLVYLRMLSIEGAKMRQGPGNRSAILELTETGFQSVSTLR